MIYIFIFFTFFYFANGIFYFFIINTLLIIKKRSIDLSLHTYPFVSIIIPAKNEADNIKKCIKSLIDQSYPKDKYEIIPVNDDSNDLTKEYLENYILEYSQIKLVNIDHNSSKGKLNAIDEGIAKAKGEIIITTDADVWMGKKWIISMVKGFDQNTGMVIGLAIESLNDKLINYFQVLDACIIRVVSLSLVEIKRPITCQGANLAFKKDAYLEVREKVLNLANKFGNREWLMQEIDIGTNWNIKTISNKDSIVSTHSPNNWFSLLNQRARWASTGKHYSKISIRIYLLFIYLSMMNFIFIPFIFSFKIIFFFWFVKFMVDLLVAYKIVKVLEIPRLYSAFPIVFVLQPFIVVISGLVGSLGLYRWK